MQSVVRSTFLVGALALATVSGLTACGDKVNVTQMPVDSTIHSVTVSPANVPLSVGDKFTFSAAVEAGPGAKDLTVTWSSGNPAVATVDATSGLVTAVAGGTTSITATSKADASKHGSAAVTVGAVVQPTVTISTINQTTGAGSVPAVLGNVIGQL